jgi:lysyl-tRNA synthetase class 2
MSERLEDIKKRRIEKVHALEQAGLEAYPSTTTRTHTNAVIIKQFDELANQSVTIVGRIRSLRGMGKLVFAHIEDGTARLQVLVKDEVVGESVYKFIVDTFDVGDFIEATGTLFVTKTGEKTLQAASCRLLAKSLLPLPAEHFGIADEETKLRKRYLDILFDPETKELFVKKAKFWQAFRDFLLREGFVEMYMPVLEPTTGGAEAEPFVTHHNALGRDFYLRISLELPLKKMLVAGYEKVFEIGRIFRNEGISATHLQDYTQMEFYWAYADFDQLLSFWQRMYQYVIMETFGTLQIEVEGQVTDWSGSWQRVNYIDLFYEHTGIDLFTASDQDLRAYCDAHKITYEDFVRRGRLIDLIFKKIRVNLPKDKPIFLVNQPIELEPLAKKVPGNPRLVQRAQLIAYGSELGKGFGELNDPIDQRERFAEQAKLREAGDAEAQMFDEGYVEAMEYGMPPAAGFGVADRLFSVLAGRPIRETVVFPPMKEEREVQTGKSKDTKIAVAVLNEGVGLAEWQRLNAVAHLSAAFAARKGRELFLQDEIVTADSASIKLNIQHAIMLKAAGSSSELFALASKAKAHGLDVAEFTREMIETTDDKKVIERTKAKVVTEVEYLGVLIFGKKVEVEALTDAFPLHG